MEAANPANLYRGKSQARRDQAAQARGDRDSGHRAHGRGVDLFRSAICRTSRRSIPLGSNIVFFSPDQCQHHPARCCWFFWSCAIWSSWSFERKRRILGSRLQVRLVLGLRRRCRWCRACCCSLSPADLLTRSFDRWFDSKVESALQGSLGNRPDLLSKFGQQRDFLRPPVEPADHRRRACSRAHRLAELKGFVQDKQREYNLGTVEIFSPDGEPLVVAVNEQVPTSGVIQTRRRVFDARVARPRSDAHGSLRRRRRDSRRRAALRRG